MDSVVIPVSCGRDHLGEPHSLHQNIVAQPFFIYGIAVN